MNNLSVFEMSSNITNERVEFSEDTAPNWLRFGGVEGSTMCNRWFWNDHIMTLKVGEEVKTDYRIIKRIK